MANELRASLNSSKNNSLKHNTHEYKIGKGEERDVIAILYNANDNCLYKSKNPSLAQTRELELAFYEKRYRGALDIQNKKHEKTGHKDRIKSMDEYYDNKNSSPDELILQVGNIDTIHPTEKQIFDMTRDFITKFKDYSPNVHFLGAFIHMDEATPHVHFRFVTDYQDDLGYNHVGKNEGLKQLGYRCDYDVPEELLAEAETPKQRKKITADWRKEHNYSQPFTADLRLDWQDTCVEHGFDIVREPRPRQKKGVNIHAYKEQTWAKLQDDIKEQAQEFIENEEIIKQQERQIREQRDSLNTMVSKFNHLKAQCEELIQDIDELTQSFTEAQKIQYNNSHPAYTALKDRLAKEVREQAGRSRSSSYSDRGLSL